MVEGIKIVVNYRPDAGTVAVGKPNCDPIIRVVKGTFQEVLNQIPAIVAEAEQLWQEKPRFAKTDKSVPAQTSPPPAKVATTPAHKPVSPNQISLF